MLFALDPIAVVVADMSAVCEKGASFEVWDMLGEDMLEESQVSVYILQPQTGFKVPFGKVCTWALVADDQVAETTQRRTKAAATPLGKAIVQWLLPTGLQLETATPALLHMRLSFQALMSSQPNKPWTTIKAPIKTFLDELHVAGS